MQAELSIISNYNHCQRFSLSQTSDRRRTGTTSIIVTSSIIQQDIIKVYLRLVSPLVSRWICYTRVM